MLVVGEDDLCCALGQQLLAQVLPEWTLSRAPINTRGVTKLRPEIPRYMEQSRHIQPVLCIADTDNACPVEWLEKWVPNGCPREFFLRLAVPESESWVLADRHGVSDFFKLSVAQTHADPEQLPDPKREVLRLAKRSKVRQIREEMVSMLDSNKQGTGYNVHLGTFVRQTWNARRAAERSSSLRRAIHRLVEFEDANP